MANLPVQRQRGARVRTNAPAQNDDAINRITLHPPSHPNPEGLGVWTGDFGPPTFAAANFRHAYLESLATVHEDPGCDVPQQIYSLREDETYLSNNFNVLSTTYGVNLWERLALIRSQISRLENQSTGLDSEVPQLNPTATSWRSQSFNPRPKAKNPHPRPSGPPSKKFSYPRPGWTHVPGHVKPGDEPYCSACWEATRFFYRTYCQHIYCQGCVIHMFREGVKPNNLQWPIKCCTGPGDFKFVFHNQGLHIMGNLKQDFDLKVEEHATPVEERHYCGKAGCQKYIPKRQSANLMNADLNSWAVACASCWLWTCTGCDRLWVACMDSGRCMKPSDLAKLAEEDYALHELAARSNWKRCHGCGSMVERVSGCPHMRCICGAAFCFKCGEEWHNDCKCDREGLRRPPNNGPPPNATVEEQLAHMQARLARLEGYQRDFDAAIAAWEADGRPDDYPALYRFYVDEE